MPERSTPIPETRLDRFKEHPNEDAKLLENVLGIRFKRHPRYFPYVSNSSQLTNNYKDGKVPSIPSGLIPFYPKTRNRGYYSFENNAYFTFFPEKSIEDSLRVGLHENMHGYVYQINPDIVEFLVGTFGILRGVNRQQLLAAELGSAKLPDFKVDVINSLTSYDKWKFKILFAINEGVPEWATAEVVARLRGLNQEDRTRFHEGWIKKSRDIVAEEYAEGHWFVFNAMNELSRDQDIATPVALDLILMQPPVDSSQPFFDIKAYGRKLRDQYLGHRHKSK